MSEWCQNKECCYKRNQNQMRGSKGNKYYQSNKAHPYYYDMFCCQGCFHAWFETNKGTCINAVGTIDKRTIGVDDDWRFKSDYRAVENVNDSGHVYYLVNYLQGVRREITREQAQTPEDIRQDYGWSTRPNSEAKPLAVQLGLAS